MKVTQSCLTLCDPMDYTVHGILQAQTLEWVAFPFPRYMPKNNPQFLSRQNSHIFYISFLPYFFYFYSPFSLSNFRSSKKILFTHTYTYMHTFFSLEPAYVTERCHKTSCIFILKFISAFIVFSNSCEGLTLDLILL